MAERDDTDELPPVTEPLPPPHRPRPFADAAPTEAVPTEAITTEAISREAIPREAATPPPVTPEAPRRGRGSRRDRTGAGDASAEATVGSPTPATSDGATVAAEAPRPRFGPARRRALLWDAGWCLVTGMLLLVLWASDRPVAEFPEWVTLGVGVAVVAWAGILGAIAAGGVGRPATALVGMINLLAGGGAVAWGWFDLDVPTLAVVLAAQVAGFGIVQLLASVRR